MDGDTEPAEKRKQHLMDEEDTQQAENRKEQHSLDGDAQQKESRKHSLDDDIEDGENKKICFQISHQDNKPSDPTNKEYPDFQYFNEISLINIISYLYGQDREDTKHTDNRKEQHSLDDDTEQADPTNKDYPDFQYFDEIAWINILSYLDDKDRVAVGRTCARLDALLGDKRLQRRHLIVAIGKDMGVEHFFTYKMIVEECSALRFCGESVRDVTFWLCDLQNVELNVLDLHRLKSEKFKEFRLKNITIKTCARHAYVCDEMTPTLVSQMCELLSGLVQGEHASQVESFHFGSRQMHGQFDLNCTAYLQVLQSTSFTTSLQKIALIDMCYCYECLESYGAVLGRFQNLQHLTVDAKMMIHILDSFCRADCKPLLQLHIIVHDSEDFDVVEYDRDTFWDPVSSWQKFLEFNPSVEVHLTAFGPALKPIEDKYYKNCYDLQEALSPNVIPLASLTVDWTKYWLDDVSDDDISDVSRVVNDFGQTIQSLTLSGAKFESKDRPLSRLLDSVQATSLKQVSVGYCSRYSEHEVACEELKLKERFPHLTLTHSFKCGCRLCAPRNGCGRSKPRGSMDFYSS